VLNASYYLHTEEVREYGICKDVLWRDLWQFSKYYPWLGSPFIVLSSIGVSFCCCSIVTMCFRISNGTVTIYSLGLSTIWLQTPLVLPSH
jgi:hypothetical protein